MAMLPEKERAASILHEHNSVQSATSSGQDSWLKTADAHYIVYGNGHKCMDMCREENAIEACSCCRSLEDIQGGGQDNQQLGQEDSFYPFTQYTQCVHQPRFYKSCCDATNGGSMGVGTGYPQEQSQELNHLQEHKYKPIMIVMHKKYKLEQNDSGMFALSPKLEGNTWHPLDLLPHPEHFDLDDFIEQVSEMIDEWYENAEPDPETSSEDKESCGEVTKLCPQTCENVAMGLTRINQENKLDPDDFLDMAVQLEQYAEKMCLVSNKLWFWIIQEMIYV